MKKNDYRFDHDTNTLIATKSFMTAASKLGTPEYKVIRELRKDYPKMQIRVEDNAPKKNAPPKLSYQQMKQFISLCRDAAERMKTYERVYALSQVQRSPYHYMKAWFLDNYANYSEKPEFDANGFVIVKTKAQMKMASVMGEETSAQDGSAAAKPQETASNAEPDEEENLEAMAS